MSQEAADRTRREYAHELAALLQRVRPDVPGDPADVLVRAAIAVINALTQVPELRGRPEIGTFAHAVLRS